MKKLFLIITLLTLSLGCASVDKCTSGDCKNGQGTMTYPDGRMYLGEFEDGHFTGQGTYTWPDGQKYVGQWKDGLKNGQGTYTWPNGAKYVGQWKEGRMNGQGTLTFPNGNKYIGEFKNDKYNGQGSFTSPDGRGYVGEFKDGEYNEQETLNADQPRRDRTSIKNLINNLIDGYNMGISFEQDDVLSIPSGFRAIDLSQQDGLYTYLVMIYVNGRSDNLLKPFYIQTNRPLNFYDSNNTIPPIKIKYIGTATYLQNRVQEKDTLLFKLVE